ncbi:hypothetical protein [Polynucleobacter sp. IMCC 30228]|uniref:hypothetical protein n=1 Tax=Polynucleobacter sp. IMCC 30228 TaxID=2781011 RepID=UPI001F2B6E2F|nr:hypothetical protein [Polynucleobacter sp. IMCC 30228]MCE7527856.1 hypothetical protein [Polynucleobacter sp. IMCC 30228]
MLNKKIYFMQNNDQDQMLRFIGIFILIIVSFFYILIKSTFVSNQLYLYVAFFTGMVLFIPLAIFLGNFIARTDFYQKYKSSSKINFIFFLLPLFVFSYGLIGIDRVVYSLEYKNILDIDGFQFSNKRFIYGFVVSFISLLAVTYFNFKKFKYQNIVIAGFIFIFILSLFRPEMGHDTLSYDPYIGPASSVALGLSPFTDVFSQYGLNYLLITLALYILPWSLFSVSLVVAALDQFYILVVILICISISRNKIRSTVLASFLVLFLISAFLYNPTYTPSALSFRYLPPLFLIYSFTRLNFNKTFSILSVCIFFVACLWSLESFIYSLIVYQAYIIFQELSKNSFQIKRVLIQSGKLQLLSLVPHLCLITLSLLFFKSWPRYDIYFELIKSQVSSSGWIVAPDPQIRTYILFGLFYSISVGYTAFKLWTLKGDSRDLRNVIILGCISLLGIMQLSYYAGRAVTPVLVFISFPLVIIAIYFYDRLISEYKFWQISTNLFSPKNIIAILFFIFIISFSLFGGVLFDRLFRPVSPIRSNSIILRECFLPKLNKDCFKRSFYAGIKDKFQWPTGFIGPNSITSSASQNLWQLIPTGMGGENIAMYIMAKKWFSDSDGYIFTWDSATLFFALRKNNPLGLTHSMVDDRSQILRARAYANINDISSVGKVIIVGDMSRQPLEQEIFQMLKDKNKLTAIESFGGVNVYRIRNSED